MRGSLEIPDYPSLIREGFAEVSTQKNEAISELGRLTEVVFTDPSGLLVILDDYHHEARVAHRSKPGTKLQVTIGGKPAPKTTEITGMLKSADEIKLGLLSSDGDAIYTFKTRSLPQTNLEDPFLQMILDSFRSHAAA